MAGRRRREGGGGGVWDRSAAKRGGTKHCILDSLSHTACSNRQRIPPTPGARAASQNTLCNGWLSEGLRCCPGCASQGGGMEPRAVWLLRASAPRARRAAECAMWIAGPAPEAAARANEANAPQRRRRHCTRPPGGGRLALGLLRAARPPRAWGVSAALGPQRPLGDICYRLPDGHSDCNTLGSVPCLTGCAGACYQYGLTNKARAAARRPALSSRATESGPPKRPAACHALNKLVATAPAGSGLLLRPLHRLRLLLRALRRCPAAHGGGQVARQGARAER